MAISTIIPLFFTFNLAFLSLAGAYNVVNYGARGDGRTDSTTAFLRAWAAACNSPYPSNVYVPRGIFMIRNAVFSGPCKSRMQFKIDGRIVAPNNFYAIANYGSWIMFYKVNRLSVNGGIIDAKGKGFWNCKMRGSNCPVGARSITLMWCNDVVVSDLTSINSQYFHFGIDHCRNVKLQNLNIRAPGGSPNTDGIHAENSMGVTVTGSLIRTGDDCISIGPGCMNFHISKVSCGPGHGISIGSLGSSENEAGVQNVTVTESVFTNTENGVRVKSWARPSGGYAKNLVFKNLVMRNVDNPVLIDQRYCPDNNCPRQSSGVKISEVTYRNIKGTSTTQAAMKFDCSPTNPCRGITLQDIKLTYINRFYKPTLSYCSNARGTHKGSVFPKSCF